MSDVPVQTLSNCEFPMSDLTRSVDELLQDVERRAFALFDARARQSGHALDDWLAAEMQVLDVPRAVLSEHDGRIALVIALPGFAVGEIAVTALPNELVVIARQSGERSGDEHDVQWTEFEKKTVCRRVSLPDAIDLESVKAELELGVLRITAKKAESTQQSAH